MIIASMIIKALPENIDELVLELNNIPSVTTYGVHKEENIIVLVEADSGRSIKRFIKIHQFGIRRSFRNVSYFHRF
ncbi:MAG: chaperone NapD [Melioribacteraceae bacterium]|nr:chaperone NapD [Melioribacteraceae bacterium]